MPKKQLKTEVDNKTSPAEEGTKKTKEALEKQEANKEKLAIDPTITQEETKKADKAKEDAMKAKKAAEKIIEKETNKMKAEDQVDAVALRKGEVKESEELTKAVKADAEKRGKTFGKCIATGVLVVK